MFRPCYTIPNGFYNLIDRIRTFAPAVPLTVLCDSNQEIYIKKRYPKLHLNRLNKSLPTLYINGRCWFSKSHFATLTKDITPNKNYIYIKDNAICGLYCNDDLNYRVFNDLLNAPSFDFLIKEIRQHGVVEEKKFVQFVSHWWDYLDMLSNSISHDFDDFFKKSLLEGDISSFTRLINDRNMFIDHMSKVNDYVVLDATNGPIVIEENAVIQPFVHIEGPCFIGKNTTIYSQSTLSACYIGHDCKIGGEVSQSLIQSYTNKRHAGYMGNSLVGEWVNIGSGSSISNLKLSYGAISSMNLKDSEIKPTGQQFLGAMVGDFVRTGINSLIECGTVISSACSIMGPMAHAKYIPPFTWGSVGNYQKIQIPQFLNSLERMMARRDVRLSEDDQALMKRLYDTAPAVQIEDQNTVDISN
jgi:UDP-N-acetylglucosamine diphosphorylase/glucosamine-1-phosphate N-acetyltransferase